MLKSTAFFVAAITIIFLVIILDVFQLKSLSYMSELLVVPIITLLYLLFNKNKDKRLLCFFVLFSIADIINLTDNNTISDWAYYICNVLYIAAYCFLIFYILKTLSFKKVFKHFLLDFTVLLLLDLYMIYVLIAIINPIDFESNFIGLIHLVEFLYSLVLIIVFSMSYLNYVQKGTKKYLYLFIACVFIAFSELILVGYYYFFEDIRLNYASTILYVLGIFLLLYHPLSTSNDNSINLVESSDN